MILYGGKLPKAWRGRSQWAPETVMLARMLHSEGYGTTWISGVLKWKHGINVSPDTVRMWVDKRFQERNKQRLNLGDAPTWERESPFA